MIPVKTFDSTGIAPNGRVYATDLNAIQAAAAGLTDLTQAISVASLIVGESGLALSRVASLEAQISGGFRATGILRGLGGLYAGQFTTAQRDALGAGLAPNGLIIFNTTSGNFEWNSGTDGARAWKALGLDTTLDLIMTGVASSADFTAQSASNYFLTAKRAADTVARIALREDGVIEWGAGGVTARDVILSRVGADRLGMGASDKFVLSSAGIEFADATTLTTALLNRIGTLASRPAANSVPAGTTYFATDQVVDYISDGSVWYRKSVPAGTVSGWYLSSGVAPTGFVVYDGTALPSSGGIYADLYAHLGTTATPDTRGRAPVGKGTHADVDAILDNDGIGVSARRPTHKHSLVNPAISAPTVSAPPINVTNPSISTPGVTVQINDPAHQHVNYISNADGENAYNRIWAGNVSDNWQSYESWATEFAYTGVTATGWLNSAPVASGAAAALASAPVASTPVASGGSVGPQTGSEPTDVIPYIVTAYIAKL